MRSFNDQATIPSPSFSKGFTLTELLVVIVVLAILASLLVVGIQGVRTRAQIAEASSNLRQIHAMAGLYSNDNRGQILPNRYQNPGQGHRWQQILVNEGYIQASRNDLQPGQDFRTLKIFGNPAVYAGRPEDAGFATFAMNVRLGHRDSPRGWHGVGSLLQAENPAKTLFLIDGVYREAGNTYNEIVWPNLSPERWGVSPSVGNDVLLLFLDGHVEKRPYQDVPITEEFGTDNRLFWRGYRENRPGG